MIDTNKLTNVIRFLSYKCENNDVERGTLRNVNISDNDETEFDAYARFVPREYDITSIPKIKEFCKKNGIDLINEFNQNMDNDELPYQDYHECYFFVNENFNKEISAEDIIKSFKESGSND